MANKTERIRRIYCTVVGFTPSPNALNKFKLLRSMHRMKLNASEEKENAANGINLILFRRISNPKERKF
jgi:hypothetical protein